MRIRHDGAAVEDRMVGLITVKLKIDSPMSLDDDAGEKLMEAVEDELELGLAAVLANLVEKFPQLRAVANDA